MITSKQYPAYRAARIIRQIDYFLICLFGIVGIFGSMGSLEWGDITAGQCLFQSGVSLVLCVLLGRWGFTAIARAIRWCRKGRQAHSIFYHN